MSGHGRVPSLSGSLRGQEILAGHSEGLCEEEERGEVDKVRKREQHGCRTKKEKREVCVCV